MLINTKSEPRFAHLARRDDVASLLAPGAIGIELGVAEGEFASRVLAHTRIGLLYGVDMYAGDRGHDLDQYKRALRRLMPFAGRSALLHMRFDQALDLFADESLDFIYVDGYAHTGEEGGATFHDWWPKLKRGGIFAGDDYDQAAWPDVVSNVNAFLAGNGLTGYLIPNVESDVAYCKYPTWFTIKP
ncbi:MAG: class I SAM-dependent methyltransferase [Hyphomonadaceae bacterium]